MQSEWWIGETHDKLPSYLFQMPFVFTVAAVLWTIWAYFIYFIAQLNKRGRQRSFVHRKTIDGNLAVVGSAQVKNILFLSWNVNKSTERKLSSPTTCRRPFRDQTLVFVIIAVKQFLKRIKFTWIFKSKVTTSCLDNFSASTVEFPKLGSTKYYLMQSNLIWNTATSSLYSWSSPVNYSSLLIQTKINPKPHFLFLSLPKYKMHYCGFDILTFILLNIFFTLTFKKKYMGEQNPIITIVFSVNSGILKLNISEQMDLDAVL